MRTDNPILCEWVNTNFGKYLNGKFVPCFLQNNLNFILGLLDADGMVLTGQSIRLVLSNYNIIKDVMNSLEYLGYPCNDIRYTGRNGWDSWGFDIPSYVAKKLIPMLNKKYDDDRCNVDNIENPMYVKYIDGDLYLKIKSINQFNLEDISTTSKVYNLSVEEDESFIANGLVVHNCFVITPPEDNLESIFDAAKKMARTYSYGGGCGTSLGNLRPNGANVNNAAQTTTGPCSFADLYSVTTELIGMKNRRGALMLSMPVTHPDIIDFINLKTDLNKVTKANISVMITNDFMEAVKNNEDWLMKFKVKDTGEVITKTAKAKDILYLLAKNNWNVAEPGMLYWDRVENWHLNSENPDFKYVSTNPCGEKPLPNGGSCMLGSLNLSEYVKNPFNNNCIFDIDTFSEDVKDVVIYMNEVLEEGIQYLPLEEQKITVKNYRQLGIGAMGLADMFIKMGITYGDNESKKIINLIFKEMANAALQQSALLAKEYGPYDKYNKQAVLASPYLKFIATPETYTMIEKYGLRNGELLSIAPTGSISTMFGVSGGVEPIFQNSYTRKSESLGEDDKDVYYKVYTPIVREYMTKHNITKEEDLPPYFVTSMDLNYRKRIEVQSELQKYIDSAISSTVNLPEKATIEDIVDLYIYAWEKGLKGITVYRDNCLRSGVLITSKTKQSTSDKIEELQTEIDKLIINSLQENPDICPMCGGEMFHSGGCAECKDCGYSPCAI